MSDPHGLVSIGADLDVKKIMAEIEESVRRKLEAGAYPPEVLAEFAPPDPEDEQLRSYQASGMADSGSPEGTPSDPFALTRLVAEVSEVAYVSPEVTTASQKALVAPAVAQTKRLIQKLVGWYITGVVGQVNTFHNRTSTAVQVLAARLMALEEGLERVEAEVGELREQYGNLRDERHGDRLVRIDRSVRDLRQRLESGAGASEAPQPARSATSEVDQSYDYFDFGERFWGSEEHISQRQAEYVDLFREAGGPIADLGSGRGEFLGLLKAAGIAAYGVEAHPDMLARSREHGHEVVEADALDHLASLEEGGLGGIFCSQMIEHLPMTDIPKFFELAARAIRPGGTLVVETVNPSSLYVFSHAFYIDLGHTRPLHRLTLEYLARIAGFQEVGTQFSDRPPDELRPRRLRDEGKGELAEMLEQIDENFRRLDDVVFGPQNYAVVACR